MQRTIFALRLVLFFSTASLGQIPVASSIYSFWDAPRAVSIRGDYAYVTARNGQLYTLDISDVEQPEFGSSIRIGFRAQSLKIINEILWATGTFGYAAFTLDDPRVPEIGVHDYGLDGFYECVTTDGQLLVVKFGNGDEEFPISIYQISDITDIGNPRVLYNDDRFNLPGSVLKDSILWGNFYGVFYAANLRDPTQPEILIRSELPLIPLNTNTEGDVLYCLQAIEGENRRLCATDISNPEQPAVIASYPDFGAITSPVFEDTIVSFLYGDSRFACLNLTDPAAPEVLIDQQIERGGFALGLGGEKGAMIDSAGLVNFYRRENFESFEYMTSLDNRGVIQEVKVVEDRAFVAAGVSGLRIVDVSDIDDTHELGYLLLPAPAIGVTANDDQTAYVATADSGIYICSVSNPEQTTILSRQPVASAVGQLETHGSYLFYYKSNALRSPGGLFVLDVQDPRQPEIVSTLNMTLFAIEGDLLYGLEGQSIVIIDISNPRDLRIIRRLNVRHGERGIERIMPAGRYLYYQYQDAIIISPGNDTYWKCLAKIDLADPDTVIVRNEWTWGETSDGPVDGDILSRKDNYFIFAASNWAGIYTIERGEFTGTNIFINASQAKSVDISGTNVYFALGSTLAIYDCADYLEVPTNHQEIPEAMLLQAFPNPFNSELKIGFNCPTARGITLAIFDTAGREVYRDVRNAVYGTGEFSVNSIDLNSGVYILQASDGVETKRMKAICLK